MEPRKSDLIRAFVKGGILSPADLLRIMEISKAVGNKYVLFGSRQDIMFPLANADERTLDSLFRKINIDYELGSDSSVYQNIVSSYVAVNLTETTNWVKEDTYHFVVDNFDFKPRIKINIVDPLQGIVPLFTGEVNFVASAEENYWYLYIRDPRKDNQIECWPKLIFTQDIARVCKALEELLLDFQPFGIDELFVILQGKMRINYKPVIQKLKLPVSSFPYYEGLNAMRNNQYWLGLYWRNNQYDIDFMTAACRLCQETNVGKINIIPWKAFIVKGIRASDRIRWEKLMGKFGINERHSSLELNWHLPVIDTEALELKRFLVRELDQQDISTHGLTFSIKTKRVSFMFTSVVIERDYAKENTERYNILYAKNFNPNSIAYVQYARSVRREVIPALLIELSKIYFRQLNPEKSLEDEKPGEDTKATAVVSYQCTQCLSVYDQRYGDSVGGIPAGVPFEQLPPDYVCHVCESAKKYFVPMKT